MQFLLWFDAAFLTRLLACPFLTAGLDPETADSCVSVPLHRRLVNKRFDCPSGSSVNMPHGCLFGILGLFAHRVIAHRHRQVDFAFSSRPPEKPSRVSRVDVSSAVASSPPGWPSEGGFRVQWPGSALFSFKCWFLSFAGDAQSIVNGQITTVSLRLYCACLCVFLLQWHLDNLDCRDRYLKVGAK